MVWHDEQGLPTMTGPVEAARLSRINFSAGWPAWSLRGRAKRSSSAPDRAVCQTGSATYRGAMAVFGFDELRVSTRGLRFAAVCLRLSSHAKGMATLSSRPDLNLSQSPRRSIPCAHCGRQASEFLRPRGDRLGD